MAIQVQMPIELRDDHGRSSTRMLMVSDRTLEVEGETERSIGQELGFRFALVGFGRTLEGRAIVEKVYDPEFGRGRCTLRIVELEKSERGTFLSWLYELTQGGGRPIHATRPVSTPSADSRRPRVISETQPSSTTLAGERRRAVGRRAIQSALSSYSEDRPRRSRPVNTDERPRRRHRIEVRVASTATPAMVMVRFNDPARFQDHYRVHLRKSALVMRYVESGLSKGDAVSLRLYLPNGSLISCPATVTKASNTAFALHFELSHSDRSTLELSAGVHLDPKQWRR